MGKDRFFQETGIKGSDWFGKFWSRWGDAVIEAGFSPNKLQAAYPEDELILKFIGLIRELRRVPVTGELRLKRLNDPSFPNDKVFFSRFGAKNQIVAKILNYCRANSGFEDVVQICALHEPDGAESATQGGIQDQEVGSVYFD